MSAETSRQRSIRALAILVCLLSLAVVAVSAYLRLDAAGLGCADWPVCYGALLATDPLPLHYGLPRLLHRMVASAALVLTCVLVWRCLRPQPVQPAARYAVLLLMLMLCLSALGFFSADPRLALVGFLNIVGGLGLVSFSWRVAMAAAPASLRPLAESAPQGRMMSAGLLVLTMTVLLGAWIGASYSAVACPTVPLCDGGGSASVPGWAALNPLVKLSSAPMPGNAVAEMLHLLHRALAFLAMMVLGAAAVSSMRYQATRRAAHAVLLLLVVAIFLGISAVLSGLNLWLVVAHGLVAAMLLAAVAALLRR